MRVCLIHYEPPHKTIKTLTESVCFYVDATGEMHADEAHRTETQDVFKLCTLDYVVEKGERAMILDVRCVYVHNEFEETFFWDVEDVFERKEEPAAAEKSQHPDVTGKMCIAIPGARYKGIVPEEARSIYKPRHAYLDIPLLSYVGLESHILGASSTCISQQGTQHEYQAFNATDPLLVFLLQHKNRFDEVNASDIKSVTAQNQHVYYLVKRHLVKRVQSFFKTLYSLIHYTQRPVLEFRWRSKPCFEPQHQQIRGRFIHAMIQVDYLVLHSQVLKYKVHGEQLNV